MISPPPSQICASCTCTVFVGENAVSQTELTIERQKSAAALVKVNGWMALKQECEALKATIDAATVSLRDGQGRFHAQSQSIAADSRAVQQRLVELEASRACVAGHIVAVTQLKVCVCV